jgi:hypothetical protein
MLETGVYSYFYQVPGTRIQLAAQHPLDDFPAPRPFVPIQKPDF